MLQFIWCIQHATYQVLHTTRYMLYTPCYVHTLRARHLCTTRQTQSRYVQYATYHMLHATSTHCSIVSHGKYYTLHTGYMARQQVQHADACILGRGHAALLECHRCTVWCHPRLVRPAHRCQAPFQLLLWPPCLLCQTQDAPIGTPKLLQQNIWGAKNVYFRK